MAKKKIAMAIAVQIRNDNFEYYVKIDSEKRLEYNQLQEFIHANMPWMANIEFYFASKTGIVWILESHEHMFFCYC